VVGVDFSKGMLLKAKKRLSVEKLDAQLIAADAEKLPFDDHSFDVVHSAGLLAVIDTQKIIEEMARVVKRNGQAIISFPIVTSLNGLFTRALTWLSGGRYNPSLFDCWYYPWEVYDRIAKVGLKVVDEIKVGWELPLPQRITKKTECPSVVRVLDYFERSFKMDWPFKFLAARLVIKGVPQ